MEIEDIKQLEYDLIKKCMIIVLKKRIYHNRRMIDTVIIKCDYDTFCEKCGKWLKSLKIK